MSIREITDGTSTTIVVVETSGSGVNWMEPRDLPFAVVKQGTNSPLRGGFSSGHGGYAQALNADGSTRPIGGTMSPEELEALFTRAGGEAIEDF